MIIILLEKNDILAPKIKGEHGTLVCQECRASFVKFVSLKIHIQHKDAGRL